MECLGGKAAYDLTDSWAVTRGLIPTAIHGFPDGVRKFWCYLLCRPAWFNPKSHLQENSGVSSKFRIRDLAGENLRYYVSAHPLVKRRKGGAGWSSRSLPRA